MKNVRIEVKGSMLTITVDLTKSLGASKSGKSDMVASTEGNQRVKGDDGQVIVVGLNVYKPKNNEPF